MHISTKDWLNFINKLSALNDKASDSMMKYVQKNGFGNTEELVDYAYAVANTYGNASAALSAAMYDAVTELEGKFYPAAEPAEPIPYGEVARQVQGTMKNSKKAESVAAAVGRLVKLQGQDTLLNNGIRDGAEFAWIPHGDTCAFCITLASNGWRPISKKAMKNGHAEHIHANCDCSYMIRHSGDVDVEGYDPEKYYEMYSNAEGKNGKQKINALRRKLYEKKKRLQKPKDNGSIEFARTSQEVTNLMKEKNWFYKCTLPDGVAFDGNAILDLTNVDVESAKALYYAHEMVFNKYPQLIGELNNVSAIPMRSKSIMGQTFIKYGRGGTFVNVDTFRNHKIIEKQYLDDLKNGGSPKGTTWKSVPVHELGHAIDDWLTYTKGKASGNGKFFSQDFMKSVLKEAGMTLQDAKTELSAYGATNTAECFAECFAEYMTSENPRKLAQVFGKRLDQIMEGI